MATSVQVFHIDRRVAIAAGLNRHITRQQFVTVGETRQVAVWVPDNADPAKTEGNVELVSRTVTLDNGKTCDLTLQQAVDRRISEAGIKPRKGQATCMEIIFSGSHDRMVAMSREELLQWANDTVEWAQKTWGKENVVSASLHVDEKTPHIHMIVVPIVTGQSRRTKNQQSTTKSSRKYNIDHKKLRLCMNEVYTTGKLYAYHDSYAKKVSNKYGLERGIMAEPGSKKNHTNSIEYNRMLAAQAAEQRSLIKELKSDYDNKKTEMQEDIQQLQGQVNTLSSAVEDEKEKLTIAQAKTKEEEDKSKKAEEQLSSQDKKITNNKGIIDKQIADINVRKEELAQINKDIETNKQTITQQKQTISDNEAIIQKQEKQKASTVINSDAADKAILEKYDIVSKLAAEEIRLQRSITDKKTELATVDANVTSRRKQLAAEVDLDTIPKKGIMGGYRSEDVDKYLQSVNTARLMLAMNNAPDNIKVDRELQKEVTRLRAVEDDFKEFRNSPQRLQQRIDYLETEAKRRSIAEILKYALQKVVEVIRFTVDKTPKGDDIFAKFTIEGKSIQYAGHISPEERISYTEKDLNSLQECKDNSREKIWWNLGLLSEIQAKREKEDTLSRFSTKLSTLLWQSIKVTDYIHDDKLRLLFASNGRMYIVFPGGDTWSTNDQRIKTLADCRKHVKDVVWIDHGNINEPVMDKGYKRKR